MILIVANFVQCAIAKSVKIEGLVSAAAKELFNAGENPARADDDDFEVFVEHGLLFRKAKAQNDD